MKYTKEETAALAGALLEKIRANGIPKVRIHTGPIEEMRPGDTAEVANEYVEEWLEQPENKASTDLSPAALEREWVDVAAWEHALSWAHTQDDAEAWELERRLLLERANQGDVQAKSLLPHLLASDAFNAFAWHGKWYHYGCQSLEIDEKYAASLCATKIATSELEYVKLPWPCFVVRVPKFLQHVRVNGEPLRCVLVNHFKYDGIATVTGKQEIDEAHFTSERYNLHLITANKFRILPASSLADWMTPNPSGSYDEVRLCEVPHDERDRRVLEVMGRLVLGAVIAMNDPKNHKRYPKSNLARDRQPGSPRYGTSSEVVLHKIGRPVKVDARETIAAYVAGRAGHVTNVRTLVAGHWKNQPHGPKSVLRRWQHVECYWRGDEDAPRIIRPHVLTGG